MKIDMHVHSHFSHDGHTRPTELIMAAKKAGLDGLAVCDHNTLAGSQAAQRVCPNDFIIIPGAEYSTDIGHVLAYFIAEGAEDQALPRLADGRFLFGALAGFVRARGGLLVLAHPLRRRQEMPAVLPRELHGLEVFNARQMARFPRTTMPTMRAAIQAGGILCAGSDAHWPGEVGGAYVEIEASSPEEARLALLAGKYLCRGRPARRRFEAMGRMGQKGLAGLPKDLARLTVFALRDVWDLRPGGRAWEQTAVN